MLNARIMIVAFLVGSVVPRTGDAQYRRPSPYTGYYSRSNEEPWARVRAVAPSRYTDADARYQYSKRPTVSPYANLARRSGPSVSNYHANVRLGQQRLQRSSAARQTYGPNRASLGVRSTSPQKPGAYYNHWYGGRKAAGVR